MSRFAPIRKVEIRQAPAEETSAFPSFKAMEFKKVTDEEEISNIVDKMLMLGVKIYMAFVVLSRDDIRKKTLGPRQYDEAVAQEIAAIFPGHHHAPSLDGFFVRSLVKAAAQLAASVVFSNDDGKVHASMSGNGVLENTYWTVGKIKKDRVVQPITSAHAVDMQLFCASVDQGRTQTQIVQQGTGVFQTVSIPSLVAKNRVEFVRIEYPLKALFHGLCVIDGDLTDEKIKRAPWIWKAIHASVKDTKLPITGLPLPLIYLTYIAASFSYRPFPVDIQDVFYKNYDNVMKELLDQVAKHSVYRGGYFVNKYHYLNAGLRKSPVKLVGGPFPVKWCSYNTNKKVTWEREGAFNEGGDLGTVIQPARSYSEFDGLFYDPALCVEQLSASTGLIIPYDKNANGLAVLEKWIIRRAARLNKSQSELKFFVYATYGPAPLLWVINDVEGKVFGSGAYRRTVVDILWKTMGSMPLYNLCASLNHLAAKDEAIWSQNNSAERQTFDDIYMDWKGAGIPMRPVISATWDSAVEHKYAAVVKGVKKDLKVPLFKLEEFADDELPGRHRIDAAVQRRKNERVDGAYDDYQDFAAADQSEASPPPGYTNKKPKYDNVATENPFNDYEGDAVDEDLQSDGEPVPDEDVNML